jgi:hypothetical protein
MRLLAVRKLHLIDRFIRDRSGDHLPADIETKGRRLALRPSTIVPAMTLRTLSFI